MAWATDATSWVGGSERVDAGPDDAITREGKKPLFLRFYHYMAASAHPAAS